MLQLIIPELVQNHEATRFYGSSSHWAAPGQECSSPCHLSLSHFFILPQLLGLRAIRRLQTG
jgi:hypothetical protein